MQYQVLKHMAMQPGPAQTCVAPARPRPLDKLDRMYRGFVLFALIVEALCLV